MRCFKSFNYSICIALLLALAACAGRGSVPSAPPTYVDATGRPDIADVHTFPQDLLPFAEKIGLQTRLVSGAAQKELSGRFLWNFFSPWRANKASLSAKDAFAGLTEKPQGYAENLLPWTEKNWTAMRLNCNREKYPSCAQRGITVRHTVMRERPTLRPRFVDPALAGKGYPFDEFQYSAFSVGTPVLITHRSRDGAWLFVENSLVAGWMPADDVACISPEFQNSWQSGTYAAIIKDDVSLKGADGTFYARAHLGAVFPVKQQSPDGLVIMVPVRTINGNAQIAHVTLSPSEATLMPLPLTAEAIARLANLMIGQSYGWGGMYENRDCSSTIRDLLTPFGIWLPRHSAVQARAGRQIDLSTLDSTSKEQALLQDGKPFLTLVWLRGHIMLYVGEQQGQAAVFHNLWGIRTTEKDQNGKEIDGRFIVGRAVVSSLSPGKELPNSSGTLLERIQSMTIMPK